MRLPILAFALLVPSVALAQDEGGLVGAAAEAQASAPPSPPPEPPFGRGERRWYGWQILAADGAALVLTVTGAESATPLVWMGVGAYVLGGPIAHFAHDNPGTAFGSLALRVGAPVVGAFGGCALDDSHGEFACLGGAALGFLVGITAAISIDAAALAYADPPRSDTSARLAPFVAPVSSPYHPRAFTGTTFGLTGVF